MSLSLSALTFVLALHSLEVAASTVTLPVPAFMLERGNSGDGNGPSSTTTSTSTSSTSSSSKHQSSTTSTSNTHISSSSASTQSSPTITQPGSTTTQSSSTLTTQSSSTSTSTPTGTVTSSSSGYAITSSSSSSSATNNAYGSTSTASQGLSTTARTGLAFGIMFFLILSAILVCYLRKRSRIAREKAFDTPAILSSEASQHHPPGPSPERDLSALPPTRLNPAYPNTSNISRSRHSANSSIAPLLSDSSRTSYSGSTWNHYGTKSQEINTQPIIMEDIPRLPNPHDPPPASARTVSHASFRPANPHDTSVLASAATSTISAPVGSSSNSRGSPVLIPPHMFNSVSDAARTR